MNLDVEAIALSQIQYLVTSLSKKNLKSAYSECIELIERFTNSSTAYQKSSKFEVEKHLIRCLYAQVDFVHEHLRPSLSQQFLSQYFIEVLYKRANFVSLVCFGIDYPIHLQVSGFSQKVPVKTLNSKPGNSSGGSNNNNSSQVLTVYAHPLLCLNAAKNLKLSALRAVQFALGLTHSIQFEVRKHAENFARQKLTELVSSLAQESKHYRSNLEIETAPEILHFVLTEITNKLLLKDTDDSGISDQSTSKLYSYQNIRSRLLECVFEAHPISKEAQTFKTNSVLTVYLQLVELQNKPKVVTSVISTGLVASEKEVSLQRDCPSVLVSGTPASTKLIKELLGLHTLMNSTEYLGDMPGSSNAGGAGISGNNTLSNMAAMAAAAGNLSGAGSNAPGSSSSGNGTQSKSHLDNALPELVRECGYQFTVSVEACRNNLRNWIGANGEIHAATVARIIGVMVRTHTGLDDSASLQNLNATGTSLWEKDKDPASPKTWNLEVFIKVIHEMPTGSTLHWKEIIYELDHPNFLVKDRQGLILLIKALKLGFQVQGFQGPFPVDMFYRQWKNSDGQVSLLQQILRYPDIFNFSDHHHHPVAVEVLKVQPDLENNRELAPWRSLELIDTLLCLAESGHTHTVKEIFSFPQSHCPDVLTLGLMQINPPITPFRTELLATNLQLFLANHPNSSVVLTHAWHSSTFNLKPIVIHSMAEWYSKALPEGDSEHARLSRILDIAQDLKALSVLLGAKAVFYFVIDLAVLASRREYLNLEKWLTDQMREHGEGFVKAAIQYLQRKLPAIMGGPQGPLTEEHLTKANFPPECLTTILICLKQIAAMLPIMTEMKETIHAMVQHSQSVLNRPPMQPPQVSGSRVPPGGLQLPGGGPIPGTGLPPPPPGVLRPPGNVGPGGRGIDSVMAVAGMAPGSSSAAIRPTPRQPVGGIPPVPTSIFAGSGNQGPPPGHSGPSADQMAGLTNQFGSSLNFGGGNGANMQTMTSQGVLASSSSSTFSLPNALGSLISGPGGQTSGAAPGSPNRIFGSNNPVGVGPSNLGTGGPDGTPVSGNSLSTFGNIPSLQPLHLPTSTSAGSSGHFGAGPQLPPPPGGMPATSVGSNTSAGNVSAGIDQIRGGVSNISTLFPDIVGPIPREVEDEANSYFQRIYNHPPNPTLTIDEVLELLKRFQDSGVQREKDVFNCMIKNLFEEYKYFPQYPDKELRVTAQLFGGIIEHGLVIMVPLGLALRFVLDAVKKPCESKMYYFGIAALDRFKSRLKDYPQYCQHLSCIGHFKDFPPHLIEWVEFGARSESPPNKPTGPVLPTHLNVTASTTSAIPPSTSVSTLGSLGNVGGPGNTTTVTSNSQLLVAKSTSTVVTTIAISGITTTTSSAPTLSAIVRPTGSGIVGRPSIANTTNIDTLLNARHKSGPQGNDAPPKQPNDKVQDKVAFIFNNLSLMNMTQKGEELKDIISGSSTNNSIDEYSCWLAQYLVMKRASIEPNFHTLYSSFLEVLHNEHLYKEVLKETYSNIRILLDSDKSIANFSDRSLLKNLGHWLGLMTLGRNRPILMIDVDIKPLIIEAYHKGQQELLYVVPFVAKVLESCAKSKVFKPPCPWTMGIMNLLCELHQEHDLKLNLKFEIEVLCKTLSIDLSIDLHPGNLLKDYDKLNQILSQIKIQGNQGTNSHQMGAQGRGHVGIGPSLTHLQGSLMGNQSVVGNKGPIVPTTAMQFAVGGMGSTMDASGPGFTGPPMGIAGAGMGAALMATPQQHVTGGLLPPQSSAFSGAINLGSRPSPQQMPSLTQPPSGHQDLSGMPPSSTSDGGMAAAFGQQQHGLGMIGTGHQSSLSQANQQISQQTSQVAAQRAAAEQHATAQQMQIRAADPKFRFLDINTTHLNSIVPQITIDARLTMLKDQPDLSQLVNIAIEKSIKEWLQPVIERAIKIALTTCELIVKQDFALDHDETRMREAAHHMVRNLTAGMAMITCRDHLHLSIKNNLTHFMMTIGRIGQNGAGGSSQAPSQEEIEITVHQIANDNVELACAFVQKKAIEKAIQEIDKHIKNELDARIIARQEGRRYCDPVALTYQAERMPEAIRLKVGGQAQQMAVYDEFARNIPGFKPLTRQEIQAITPKRLDQPSQGIQEHISTSSIPQEGPRRMPGFDGQQIPDDCIAILGEVKNKVHPFVQNCTSLPANPHMANLHSLIEALNVSKQTKDAGSLNILIQKSVENLLEGLTQINVDTESLARYRDANLLVLRALSDQRSYGANWTTSRVTQALVEAREDIRYNLDAFDCFVRSGFVSLCDYDKHLAATIGPNGENAIATQFAMHLCKIYLIDDRTGSTAGPQVLESDLMTTIEALTRIAQRGAQGQPGSGPPVPEGIHNLVDMIKMSSERLEPNNMSMAGPTAQLHSGIAQAREFEDPPGLLEKTEYLLREWVNAYHARDAGKDSRQAFVIFVQLMNQHGILKTDDLITRFFRMSTQMCVDLCYRALAEQNNAPTLVRAKCFHTLDAYVRLITLLVKHSGETANTVTKVNLLNKVLGIVAGVLLIDHDVRHTQFQQVPYHRIFIMLFLELNAPDAILENINFQVLHAYCNMLHILRPVKAPGFAYAWLEIVSHRVFMGRILATNSQPNGHQKGWPVYAQLLVDLFKFLSSFLRNAELAKPVHRLYRGTLRVLLVLLHDFPEFLCDHHYNFCDVIPPNCIQMRNLILSAFPRNMRLPDPFTPNLKVECLPEIAVAPRTVANYASIIKPNFKKDLDSYLKNRAPVSFLSEIRANLQVANAGEPSGNRYNIQLINALVMHVGTSAIQFIRSKGQSPSMSSIAHSSHMDIFQNLAVDLETEGRYLFLNCIANQLRYPNSHTHYFSCTLLYLFAEANQESIQEQITRVLLERLIVNRPHPWGLLITFIELIKNPSYKFWDHEFVHCAPEIQKLFESVARSCMVHTPMSAAAQQLPVGELPQRIEVAEPK